MALVTLVLLYGPLFALVGYWAMATWRAAGVERQQRAWMGLLMIPWALGVVLMACLGIEPLGTPRTSWGLPLMTTLPGWSAILLVALAVWLKGQRLRVALFGIANLLVTACLSLLGFMRLSGNWI